MYKETDPSASKKEYEVVVVLNLRKSRVEGLISDGTCHVLISANPRLFEHLKAEHEPPHETESYVACIG